MKKAKTLAALLLALALTVSLAACSTNSNDAGGSSDAGGNTGNTNNAPSTGTSGSDTSDYDGEKVVTVGISGDPAWGPWASFTPGRKNTAGMIYQPLLSQIPDPSTGEVTVYMVMMSGYEKVGDSTYRVHLRDGIYDTAGNPFTADDAKFSLLKAQESGKVSGMNDMGEVTVVDSLTLDIEVKATMAVGDFEELLTAPNMVTQASFEASPDEMLTTPIGTTGYVLTEYTPGSTCTIAKADVEYWNEAANQSKSLDDGYCPIYETGRIDTVNFKVITDTSSMAISLEAGDIDIASTIASTDMRLFENNPDYSIADIPGNVMYLCMNTDASSPMSNINLRKAVAYCFDSEDCLEAAYEGSGVAANGWGYPSQIGYQKSWDSEDYFAYNMDTAKEYLDAYYAETGKSASDVHIRILCTTTADHVKICEVLQASIDALIGNGTCELLQYETNSFNELQDDPTAYDMLLQWGMANKPYVIYNWNISANAARRTSGLTYFNNNDPELQRLINEAIGEDTFGDDSLNAFHDYVKEQCYAICVCTGYTHWVASSWVQSFVIGPKDCVVPNAMDYDWNAR